MFKESLFLTKTFVKKPEKLVYQDITAQFCQRNQDQGMSSRVEVLSTK